nr:MULTISPECIES: hypothetical protein [Roseiflexus]
MDGLGWRGDLAGIEVDTASAHSVDLPGNRHWCANRNADLAEPRRARINDDLPCSVIE